MFSAGFRSSLHDTLSRNPASVGLGKEKECEPAEDEGTFGSITERYRRGQDLGVPGRPHCCAVLSTREEESYESLPKSSTLGSRFVQATGKTFLVPSARGRKVRGSAERR